MPLAVEPIAAFETNYIWAIHNGRDCALVDPGSSAEPLSFLRERGLNLCALILTHHHYDHIGGVDDLLAEKAVPVWGPVDERIPQVNQPVGEGDRASVPELELQFEVLETPGHTSTHIIYHNDEMMLAGDTLFSIGCGRLFEGTPEQMHASLAKLAALPADTRVYCGHEYTESNIRFARRVEPANPDLAAREQEVHGLRQRGQPTLPSTIEWELRTNPFLRVGERGVAQAASERAGKNLASPVAVFAEIRRWKDAG